MPSVRAEILPGTKFGSLTVIRRTEDYISHRGQHEKNIYANVIAEKSILLVGVG